MTPKPTLVYNDLVVESNQNRLFAISYLGEKLPHAAVILYTKKDGTCDNFLTIFDYTKFGDARRAMKEIPPELVVKLYADTASWESERSKLAQKSLKPKADAFIESYKLAKQEFDAKIKALESEYDVKESCVDYDGDYDTTTLCVTVFDQQTGFSITFDEIINN